MSSKSSFLIAFATLGLLSAVACTKSSSSDSSPSVNSAEPSLATSVNPVADETEVTVYSPGIAAHTSDVVSLSMYRADGTALTTEDLVPLFATYSVFADSSKELSIINRAVLTTDSHLELYSSSELVMVFEVSQTDVNAKLVWSRNALVPESVSFASQVVDQQEMTSALNINLKACTTPEKQAPDQTQSKDKMPVPVIEPVCEVMQTILLMKEQPTPKQETPKQDQSQEKEQKGKN